MLPNKIIARSVLHENSYKSNMICMNNRSYFFEKTFLTHNNDNATLTFRLPFLGMLTRKYLLDLLRIKVINIAYSKLYLSHNTSIKDGIKISAAVILQRQVTYSKPFFICTIQALLLPMNYRMSSHKHFNELFAYLNKTSLSLKKPFGGTPIKV